MKGWQFVLEVETGLIDGWYHPDSPIGDTLKRWSDRRPQYNHLLCKMEGEAPDLPDSRCLPVQHFKFD